MTDFELTAHPHRRFNPLTGDWVLVSPQRTQRPWQGQVEPAATEAQPEYDPQCYLCPGNARNGGARNPQYQTTFVFDNDFPALEPDTAMADFADGELLVARSEPGRCRVVCFSPRHDLTLARMETAQVRRVVDAWAEEYSRLGSDPRINSVFVFENRGAMMGCSNPHPHGQIWANQTIPNELQREMNSFRAYRQSHAATLLSDYLAIELKRQERVVYSNDHFVLLVPFWAGWPFETMLVSRRAVASLAELSEAERDGLADAMKNATVRYDNLFRMPFPYTMGFHQGPTDGGSYPEFHLHAHYFPPLLRSATVRKFMVGYEMLAMPQRDITPEAAAEQLRKQPGKHYLETI